MPRFFRALTNGDVAPDGFTRQAVLVNGQAPGPLIIGNKGDTMNLNVIEFDQPDDALELEYRMSYSPPSSTRSYIAPLYDPYDPHAALYETTIILLDDWLPIDPAHMDHGPTSTLGLVPTLVSTLINGLGRYARGPTSQLTFIRVTAVQRYRYDPSFIFTIDGHTMTIIEADSVNTEPLTVDTIQICTHSTPVAGQRYSFVMTADQTIDPVTEVTDATAALVETDLHPLVATAVPGTAVSGGADVVMDLTISLDFSTFKFAINGDTFTPPTVPVLLQILSGAQSATDLLLTGSVFTLPANSVGELSIPGGSAGAPHPFHLHGHNFFVIKSAGNDTFNFDNPSIRDVSCASDNTTIRFVTDNAGP
ncbi:laccase [Mycena vulgaris]|nr:laccase [Mycena vulgaris]